ncbi:C40 family peptidase [Pseudogracilibacillus sp. SO30301A]|uniref:C40 family peptidase n=1 Tax=Pseudogracilibacillus sp. SO30301A TaxID=3098291 RepID=UPI00300E512F
MSKNKVFMSVTASAVIASTMFGGQTADAASYKVKPGDSLWSISQKYNTSVANLQAWNNLSNHIISPNQVIEVDGSPSNSKAPSKDKSTTPSKASTYTVKDGDSLSKIAAEHGISLKNLMDWNNLSTTLIYPGDKLVVSKDAANSKPSNSGSSSSENSSTGSSSSGSTYTVKSGDTLGEIAKAHGISLNNLMKWNNLSSHLIYPGDKLAVSSSGKSSSSDSSNSGSSGGGSSSGKTSTYTVKSGDTLDKISSNHGISLSNLKKWNNLTSNTIYPGDKLAVSSSGKSSSSDSSNSGSNGGGSSSDKTSTYTVKSGDTLDKIASSHGVSLSNLKKWNNLTSDTIYPGNKLVVSGKAASSDSKPSKPSTPASGDLISTAKSVMGVPYEWGGSSPSGFDCSGFIYWAFEQSGQSIGRLSTDGYYNRSYIVNSPQVGDLVFFEGTYRSGISHMGIYLGNNQFIHAGTSTGVTITSLSNSYWSKHFHSFKRFY